MAEFERDTIRERTKAGLSAAKARGRMGGKKKGLSPEAKKKAETAATKRNLQSKLQELLEWVEQQCTDI